SHEALRGRPLWRGKVVAVPKARAPRECLARALDYLEPHDRGGPHLHRGHTHFAVALGEVAVAHGEQGALDRDGHLQGRAFRDLLDVEIAPILRRRDRAEPLGGGRSAGRDRPRWIRRHDEPATAQESLFALGPCGHLLTGWREPDDAHERCSRNAHTWEL